MYAEDSKLLYRFSKLGEDALAATNPTAFKYCLDDYVRLLISHNTNHDSLFGLFIEDKMIHELLKKLQEHHFHEYYFAIVFHNLELLIKSLKEDEETLYLVTQLHKYGYLTEKYDFYKDGIAEYYVLIVKSLLRTMLMQDERFINIFVNVKQPHCPAAFMMLRFFNFKEYQVATASKYILLEMSSHNNLQTAYMKEYFLNFPFVSYYAYLALYLRDLFYSTIKNMSPTDIEFLTLQIVFMEELVSKKGSETINMYTNAVMACLVRRIFRMLVEDRTDASKIYRLLASVCQKIKVEKVRIGFRMFLEPHISSDFYDFLSEKQPHPASYTFKFKNKNYLDDYMSYIVEHCRCLLTKEYRDDSSKSFVSKIFSNVSSYVSSNEVWLVSEIKKLEEVLGVQIPLCRPIDHDKPTKMAFISLFDREKQPKIVNKLFKQVMDEAKDNYANYHSFLVLLSELFQNGEPFQYDIPFHLQLLQQYQSINILFTAWKICQKCHNFPLEYAHKPLANYYYRNTVSRLVNFTLEESWYSLINNCHELKNMPKIDDTYHPGIFRSIDCYIVFLLILRLMLNLPREECLYPLQDVNPPTKNEMAGVKIMCSLSNEQNTKHYIKIDGQYVRIYTDKDEMVGYYPIKTYKIFEDPKNPSVLYFINADKYCFSVYFADDKLATYFNEYFKSVRSKVRGYELEIYNLCFSLPL